MSDTERDKQQDITVNQYLCEFACVHVHMYMFVSLRVGVTDTKRVVNAQNKATICPNVHTYVAICSIYTIL